MVLPQRRRDTEEVALLGALVLAKVVLVLEYIPLGAWAQARPAWVDVMLRTALYAFGVFVVLLLEKAFEGRHEHGGFGASLIAVFQHADAKHVWLNTVCLSAALLSYTTCCPWSANALAKVHCCRCF